MKECCGKCKDFPLVSLGFSKETEDLAKKAVEKCKSCKDEDINKWAARLADDVYNAND